jgi:putative hemolysin
VFDAVEQVIVERVFKLGDRQVGELMTPRHEVVWLDAADAPDELRVIVTNADHSRFPVARGGLDDIVGVVRAKAMLAAEPPIDLLALIEQPVFIPETMDAFRVLEVFRRTASKLAIVVDEYGGTQGIVTPDDVLVAIVGSFPAIDRSGPQQVAPLQDGSWSIDGMLAVDELQELLDLEETPADERGAYRSVGGLVMTQLGRIPSEGDTVEWAGFRFEVLDMDGKRIDRILVHRLDSGDEESPGENGTA